LVGVYLVFLLLFHQLVLATHLFLLASAPDFISALSLECFLHFLLFDKSWVWLHVDGYNQGGECIASDDPSVVHDILRGDLAAGDQRLNE
jgi:hypothetical protein